MYHEYTYRIDARSTDPFRQCRPSALLSTLQEAAAQAAVELHVSRREMMECYNCFWMLARIWYRLDKPLFGGDDLTIRTFHRGNKGAAMYRDYDLYRNGELIGEAVSTWVLADWDSRKLLRLGRVREIESTTGGELCKSIRLQRVRLPERMTLAEERLLHYSDADINGHVNNARYADLACDAVHLERLGEGKFVSSLQISYLKECRPGEIINLSAGQEEGAWYVHGADQEGTARFDASLSLESAQ